MPDKAEELLEIEALLELQQNYNWRIFRNLLNRRRIHCDEEMKNCLRKNDHPGAFQWLSKSDEILYITDKIIVNRKNELNRMVKEK